MKKALYLGIIVFVICMFSRITQAQKDSGETEVLAYILPDSLEMPGNEKGR